MACLPVQRQNNERRKKSNELRKFRDEFGFVFFDKIFGTLAESSSIPPFLAVWFPNFIFGILAFYLLRNARR